MFGEILTGEIKNTSTCSHTPYACGICRSDWRSLISQTLVYNPNICGSCRSLIGQHKKKKKTQKKRNEKKKKNEQHGPHQKSG